MGTLKLYGYLRGRNLNVNSLVHLPSLGTFQMTEIYVSKRNATEKMGDMWSLEQQADQTKQESLDREAVYDEMNAEQTWPTEQELAEAQVKSVRKKVPKGTSDYQAAWILDSEEEEVTDESDGEEDDDDDDDDSEEDDDDKENEDDEEEGESGDENIEDDASSIQEEEMETVRN
jgi:pre-rRNA-processing protein TSR1